MSEKTIKDLRHQRIYYCNKLKQDRNERNELQSNNNNLER
jgi:hypothetical protein